MTSISIRAGMPLREAYAAARALGADVHIRSGTGEMTVAFPGRPPLHVNNRKKDAPRALTSLLRSVRR